ncbi:rhodanese-like domain-containing protein [Blastococcus mobilis]|uniref:Rhodanese-related sulfurtransferase n=1 Tax=Blastococcus mobilis TaxID=1938746 RepID=A0A238YFR9_9ACTN|nr:rhodanese-like domain-containing protein [Blastococcus mobilis]SNR69822.1 Rhodanese-related sulfurtransferase [Blastococcus mobilis]
MIPEIDQNAFAARLAEGGSLVVDVREAREYRPGHVPGAENLPLSLLPARLPELPKNRPVYVICQAGGRSAQATALMRAVGIDAISVTGGTGAWIESGRPVETAA